MLPCHHAMSHVPADTLDHEGTVFAFEQYCTARLAVLVEPVAAVFRLHDHIGDEIDPKARRIARYQGKIEQMLGLRKCRGDWHEIVLKQLQPNCLCIAERKNGICMGRFRRAGLAQRLRQSSIALE